MNFSSILYFAYESSKFNQIEKMNLLLTQGEGLEDITSDP